MGIGVPESGPLVFISKFFDQNRETIEATATGLASLTSEGRSIESAVSSFSETAKVVIKGLDALAQVHPAIGVAVIAFKLVVTFDMTRRENNKKVLALKIEMQDMMIVLFELRHIRDPMDEGPDGSPLRTRMQTLMEKIAHDIRDAGSACDAYMKKSFLALTSQSPARTLKSKIYESRLAEFGVTFESNKTELQRALSLHVTQGVDTANEKLNAQSLKLDSVESKIDLILQIFRKLDTPREKEVQKFLDDSGGPKTCIEDDDLLTRLVEISGERFSAINGPAMEDKTIGRAREVLLKELQEDVNKMFETNFVGFQRKLAMQSYQLAAIQASNEHIVEMLNSGSHEKILDHDLQAIWREMGWRGSVKARHFVLALHDYYSDRSAFSSHESNVFPDTLVIDDSWALAYVDIAHVQPIMETVDDDGTGFVSIKEVNTFVTSRPLDWTLLQRLAYWAAGWHISVSSYKRKIYLQVQKMFELRTHLALGNRRLIEEYLGSLPLLCLENILRSTRSIGAVQHHPELAKLIDRFDREEEERLVANLTAVGFEVDSAETVALVTGPGRFERFLFPLVHVLLKRDLRIFTLARKHILHAEELGKSLRSLLSIFQVVDERVERIAGGFKQVHADVNMRLGSFAFGMFQIYYDKWYRLDQRPAVRVENSYLEWLDDSSGGEDVEMQDPDSIPITELKLPLVDLTVLASGFLDPPYTAEIPDDPTPLGHWVGHFRIISPDGMTSFDRMELRIDCLSDGDITGVVQSWKGSLTFTGTMDVDNDIKLWFYESGYYMRMCEVKFDPEHQRLTGHWAIDPPADIESQVVIFRRTPTHLDRFYYDHGAFQKSPARARWAFARDAILHEVGRKSWSWTYLKSRIRELKRTLALSTRSRIMSQNIAPTTRLSQEEIDELALVRSTADVQITRMCDVLAQFHVDRLMVKHLGCWCDSCGRVLYEMRMICLVCVDKGFTNTTDICRECMMLSCSRGQLKHDPSHSMIKFEYVVHNFKEVWPSHTNAAHAKIALKAAEEAVTSRGKDEGGLPSDSGPSNSTSSILCVYCLKPVSVPCWVCRVCVPHIFICTTCEEARIPPTEDDGHRLDHALIRISTTKPDPQTDADEPSLEARLAAFETKVEDRTIQLETRVAQLETKVQERLTQLETKIQERLGVLEHLLSQIVAQTSPSS
ncbi:hypothetical protein BDN72DRAFT_922091 [Pluteus cervinus]|uniref:Uncharacterized protein n=1 Tax=Pluteus cervinus TaxID=181527 RepID=A0ACD3AH13_9AGAR|nr:hypothetical protein BDN72DRAFT_922091 [Pluteus cervinus]